MNLTLDQELESKESDDDGEKEVIDAYGPNKEDDDDKSESEKSEDSEPPSVTSIAITTIPPPQIMII